MKYLDLNTYAGKLKISKLAFGTGSAMKLLDKEDYFQLFDLFFQAGGNCLDTAPGYNGGNSAKYIGEWMKARGNRGQIVISTKACHAFSGEPSRLSFNDMKSDLDESLEALQTDVVDLLWIHNDDVNWPVEDIIQSVDAIVKTGKVKAVGCSNWTVNRIAQANAYARANSLHGFLASQIQWSLARVEGEAYVKRYGALVMDDASYAWYLQNQMPVFAFSALAQGFFARAVVDGIDSLPAEKRAYFETPGNLKRLEHVKNYMVEHQVPSSVPVLGYLINNKLPGVALISARTPDMILEALAAADCEMSSQEADGLFEI